MRAHRFSPFAPAPMPARAGRSRADLKIASGSPFEMSQQRGASCRQRAAHRCGLEPTRSSDAHRAVVAAVLVVARLVPLVFTAILGALRSDAVIDEEARQVAT